MFDAFLEDGPDLYKHPPPYSIPIAALELLGEVYRSLHAHSPRLVVMGLRAIIDVVCHDKVGDCGGFKDKLRAQLYDLQWEPQLQFETVTTTMRPVLLAPGSGFKIEVFLLGPDAHDQERFRRRTPILVLGRRAYAATAEDVIITKLRWSRQGKRTKDVDDVRNVIAVSGERIDWDYVHRWTQEHGTRQLLDEIRRSLPGV